MRPAEALIEAIDQIDLFAPQGTVRSVGASRIESDGPLAALGDLCRIALDDGQHCLAEVSAIDHERVVLVPLDDRCRIRPGTPVIADRIRPPMPVGDGFKGRAIDGLGAPIDGAGPISGIVRRGAVQPIIAPLDRVSPSEILPTGIAAIDALLTLGIGQRIGVFSASGVGKTSLIQQLARQIVCDHVILCLIGERGREVESFWQEHLSGRNDSTVTIVTATSDASAPMRVRALDQALALAENWRNAGRHALLVVDSVTRYAMALREIGMAAGEPPTLRGFTPNVLTALPKVVERCGCQRGGGAITGLFTILSETDDVDDPIVEVMKSLLDGHIILSRTMAHMGQFPAINVSRSISRLASDLIDQPHKASARAVLRLLASYEEARMLIESGLYVAGGDRQIDEAIAARPAILEFLAQPTDVSRPWTECIGRLATLGKGGQLG
jgi:flagellum-specific ATP synthase